MNFTEHILISTGSLCTFLLAADLTGFSPVPDPLTLATGLGMAALGAIAVDIDHPSAFISSTAPTRLFKIASRFLFFVSLPAIITIASGRRLNLMEPGRLVQEDLFRLLVVVALGAGGVFLLSRIIHGLFEHRGPIHSPAFFVAITASVTLSLGLFVTRWWWMGTLFGWGWFSHLAADSLTHQGIPLLWPLSDEKIGFMPGCLLAPIRLFLVGFSILSVILLLARYLGIL
jgi:membrane-bound metal-dependent hydrolase YbcI (DUF457 family)